MLKFNSKFSREDNALANFAHIISSPVCLAVINLITNQPGVTAKHIYTLPHPLGLIKKALAKLELTGIIKLSGSFYATDSTALQHLSGNFKVFIHHLSA